MKRPMKPPPQPPAFARNGRRIHRPGVRTQLTLWYTGVFAGLLLIFGVVFYTNLQASLASSLDATLTQRAQRIAAGISYSHGVIVIEDDNGDLPALNGDTISVDAEDHATVTPTATGTPHASADDSNAHNGQDDQGKNHPVAVTSGALARILDASGKAIYTSPAFRSLTTPTASVTDPLRGVSWLGTIQASGGSQVRLLAIPLLAGGRVYGVAQVGAPRAAADQTLQHVGLEWLVAAPLMLALGAWGSYLLAGRAFRPMGRLIDVARQIEAGDLRQRVPVPPTRDEVARLAITLNEMIARLDASFAHQRRFVADASHDLRTPVAAIRSMTDVALEQGATPSEMLAVLRDVNAEAQRLSRLIGELLALARADEGHLTPEHEAIRLDLLAVDAVESLEPLAHEHGIFLTTGAMQPLELLGDQTQLIQLLMALLDNAILYTNRGGRVHVSLRLVDDLSGAPTAELAVGDTGIGVAPEHLPHLFERFYRADGARSRAAGGSGLGLALAQEVAHAHGGRITVESRPGVGSTFHVFLPLGTRRSEVSRRGEAASIDARFQAKVGYP